MGVLVLYTKALFVLLIGIFMNENEIIYSTVDEQIEKLLSQHLIINNIDFAKEQLGLYGYFNLIKSYRDPYSIPTPDGLKYRSGITFEQITSLYILDKNLRNSVISAMLDLEEHLKAAMADVISDSFGTNVDDYLNFRNYRDRRRSNGKFSLNNILLEMRKATQVNKQPVCHYRTQHGTIPPWILFKNVYFSTIVNLAGDFKAAEKEKLVNHLYNVNSSPFPLENLKRIMIDTLFICLEYRNLAAHGGRTYNHTCKASLNYEYYPFDQTSGPKGFSQLLYLLSLLNYKNPFKLLKRTLEAEVNRHCNNYPEDVTYLAQILNVDIIPHRLVWLSKNKKIYHQNPHCSGMSDCKSAVIEDAVENGYKPCSKCCN